MQSSFFTFTALAAPLAECLRPGRPPRLRRVRRFRKPRSWLMSTPTTNSEDRAFRLLGLKWAGVSQDERKHAVADILADQHPDGGWAQLPNMQSDAYATGQALGNALRTAGAKLLIPVYRRGVTFLKLRTQDQGWLLVRSQAHGMPANNYLDCGFPLYGESQYASFNATCWATMALAEASR